MPKAYEQVADRLRQLIVTEELARGERLPNELQLADEFGVSRATVREALRLLAAQSLIRTAKGVGGGSYVTAPSAENVSESLRSGLGLMTSSADVTLEELLEVRALLEVPAARLAALRRSDEHLERCVRPYPASRSASAPRSSSSTTPTSTPPSSTPAATRCSRSPPSPSSRCSRRGSRARGSDGRFHRSVNDHHREIAAAIESAEEQAAGELMHEHLGFLRPYYEQAWRDVGGRA